MVSARAITLDDIDSQGPKVDFFLGQTAKKIAFRQRAKSDPLNSDFLPIDRDDLD
jgi:hypothetical protein